MTNTAFLLFVIREGRCCLAPNIKVGAVIDDEDLWNKIQDKDKVQPTVFTRELDTLSNQYSSKSI